MPTLKRKKGGFAWVVYYILYSFFIAFKTIEFFEPGSTIQTYYQILLAFDLRFILHYSLNILSVLLNVFSLVPFFFFIIDIAILSPTFWKMFFVVRLLTDLTGRSYEFFFIKSLFYQNIRAPLFLILLSAAFILPCYIANFRYAFKSDKE